MKKSFILFVFLLCSIVVVAQKKSITGIITDTAGEAVIGASIVEVDIGALWEPVWRSPAVCGI